MVLEPNSVSTINYKLLMDSIVIDTPDRGQQIKNSHILPTGQWYAPSAVINDALIMPEYASACQSMQEYARVC